MKPVLQDVLNIIGSIVNYKWKIYYNKNDYVYHVPHRFDKTYNKLRIYTKGILEEYPISICDIFIINRYIIMHEEDYHTDITFSFKDVTIKPIFYKNIMSNIKKS